MTHSFWSEIRDKEVLVVPFHFVLSIIGPAAVIPYTVNARRRCKGPALQSQGKSKGAGIPPLPLISHVAPTKKQY